MENNDDKEKEVKPQDSSHDPVPPSQEPEKKPDEGRKEAKPKDIVHRGCGLRDVLTEDS